jgi:hypothetical protein
MPQGLLCTDRFIHIFNNSDVVGMVISIFFIAPLEKPDRYVLYLK